MKMAAVRNCLFPATYATIPSTIHVRAVFAVEERTAPGDSSMTASIPPDGAASFVISRSTLNTLRTRFFEFSL